MPGVCAPVGVDRLTCRGCAGQTAVVWDLPASPYGDLFRVDQIAARTLPYHPLTLSVCDACYLLQLAGTVDVDQIYSDYLYQTRVNPGLVRFYDRLGGERAHHLPADGFIIDVGGNDGSALRPYHLRGLRTLNIDPAAPAVHAARVNGISSVQTHLTGASAGLIREEHGPAHLVTAHYVTANVPHPAEFLRNLRHLTHDHGMVSIITGYHPDQFTSGMFDYINHDHQTYLTVTTLTGLAERAGLYVVGVRKYPHKAGSIQVDMRPVGVGEADESVALHVQEERWRDVHNPERIHQFRDRIERAGRVVRDMLEELAWPRIPGVGASISTTHLINQFQLAPWLDRLLDDDPRKIGMFAPGTGLPVEPLGKTRGPGVILLAWQVTNSLLERLHTTGYHGQVLIPLPTPTLVRT